MKKIIVGLLILNSAYIYTNSTIQQELEKIETQVKSMANKTSREKAETLYKQFLNLHLKNPTKTWWDPLKWEIFLPKEESKKSQRVMASLAFKINNLYNTQATQDKIDKIALTDKNKSQQAQDLYTRLMNAQEEQNDLYMQANYLHNLWIIEATREPKNDLTRNIASFILSEYGQTLPEASALTHSINLLQSQLDELLKQKK